MIEGTIRISAASPEVALANPAVNADRIIRLIDSLHNAGSQVILFPELSVTGYSCADLFHNSVLLDESDRAFESIVASTAGKQVIAVVGLPVRKSDALYNCAAVIFNGRPVMIVPKHYIPNYNEFYEYRWFAIPEQSPSTVTIGSLTDIPFLPYGVVKAGDARLGIEICEDLWTPIPPSCHLSISGANIILNLSASNDLIGKHDYLKSLISQQSARCNVAYIYASAGWGESSTDLVFDPKTLIAENGSILAQSSRWNLSSVSATADIDLSALNHDRLHNRSFNQSAKENAVGVSQIVLSDFKIKYSDNTLRNINPHPFVPSSTDLLDQRCEEITNIQALGLARRLQATNCRSLIVGISGGLDSTLALLVACKTFDMMSLPRTGIVGVTMPGFGTTGRTYNNAVNLMKALGITIREISIVDAVMQHFRDISHDPAVTDVTYENSQARERTQLLMDIANQQSGMVLGTGDLSELALGWATYNGDHMSMYGVNAGIPKTLVRHLVSYFADTTTDKDTGAILRDIVDTPISPELIPADDKGNIAQKTEDLVGPYDLHDFFLYYMLRYGFSPQRIFQMATQAFDGTFDKTTILHWLRTFMRRFFNQQFKRSCLPDGPKVGSVCLSPRGDWRMPSDAHASAWLAQVDSL